MTRRYQPHPARRRAFMQVDSLMALSVLLILLVALAVVVSSHQKALLRLSNARTAMSNAEQRLLTLQTGGTTGVPDAAVQVHPLAAPAPKGFMWVEVCSTVGASQSRLTGLVPETTEGGHP